MSATFDSTTTAAYAAANTAAERSALIVAALTGTISVKVFNGSNTEMGSGTMDSPWATASGGTVTVGEVTSFTVGTTGTPDADWYIRFQNAGVTRWVRGSFGLEGSGQDFTWSLGTWTATHTGTIGVATISTSGNVAPAFTVAPTSASIAATGGTIQFTAVDPDGDAVVYSLTTTRTGFTINASTGLVTVTAAAADTSGDIAVQASDGILTVTATCAVLVFGTSVSATRIVKTDAGASYGGLPAYTTINAALAACVPGDIVEIVAATGTSQTLAQAVAFTVSGTAGNPITLRVRDGHSIMLSAAGTLLAITGDYVTVQGNSTGRTGLVIGDVTTWDHTLWNTSYPQTRSITIASSNVTLERLTATGARSYSANLFYGTASDIVVRDVLFTTHGTNNYSDGKDYGDLVLNSAQRTLFEDVDIERGGHNLLNAVAPYQVYRRVTLDADWLSWITTGKPGCRGAVFGPGNHTNRSPATAFPGVYGPMLVDDCIIKNVDSSGDQAGNACMKMQGLRVIVRGSYFWDNEGHLFNGPGYADATDESGAEVMSRGYAYHNTSYVSAGIWDNIDVSTAASSNQREYRFLNNVFAETSNGRTRAAGDYTVNVVDWDGDIIPLGAYANSWKGSVWAHNIFTGDATLMNFKLTGTGANTLGVADGMPAGWSANIYGNDLETSLTFLSAAARTRNGLTITAGVGYQDAEPLTLANGAGVSSTTLIVDDAGYFYDGTWSVDGEEGDWIKIGSGAVVQITAANWTTNTLTLASARTWSDNDTVYYAGNAGTDNAGTLFDNRGAGQ